ncbi:biopolymer transporter ExbD [Roseospira marina]|uniref:Biopolymer transporter ExbD n=1 Tax=Roseospira marina TaxID=140057 RepID=A0A5M6I8F2_9PROT|nr:biopolymer transporter ExbD [Roseospira marina]KAA5604085.1 biopolymer transporter ExbD [Roseospira marina]MBB4315817.1 biopolymer transport protein ExbD [Roseospira marina]MBB5088944.1 biopolymer transport protein ExbD [Roseospira marina]
MRFEPRRHTSDDERILPLINVVFLLLIFFMLAGTLSAMDPFEITPPRSASSGEDNPRDIVVLVGADGRLALDGTPVAEADFEAALAAQLTESEGARVRLKADGHADATHVVALMERLRAAGVTRVLLLTIRDEA